MTVDQVLNTLPFGIGVAASSRLGNLLGGRKAGHAHLSSHAAVSFATAVGLLVLAVLMATRSQFGRLFSDDEDVVKLVAAVLPVNLSSRRATDRS
jgi:multidrug resistance protein, MATE family